MENKAAAQEPEAFVPHDRLTVCGTVTASPAFVRRFGRCNWLRNKVYNAALDDRVAFEEGFAYRVAESDAYRTGTAMPDAPARSETYLPIPDYGDLEKRFRALSQVYPALATFVPSLFLTALEEACEARAENVKRIVAAAKAGGKRPRLGFRSADDDWCVVTDSFTVRRTGDMPAAQPGKTRFATPKRRANAEANRRRRAKRHAEKEIRKAEKRLAAGWKEHEVQVWLWERTLRAERSRAENAAYDAMRRAAGYPEPGMPRKDSPLAHVGQRRLNVHVDGLGTVRVNVDRAISQDAEIVRVAFIKPPGRDAKVEVRLTIRFPRRPTIDAAGNLLPTKAERGERLHAALRHLPPNPSSLTIMETLHASGVKVRGVDLNNASPTVDDRDVRTRPVRLPRHEIRAMEALQRGLAHKDECRKELEKRERQEKKQNKAAKVVALSKPDPTEAERADVARRRKKRSNTAERERGRLAKLARKAANRQKTRALQNAAHLLRDDLDALAMDPPRMVKRLLASGGPAERRAKRKAEEAKAGASPDAAVFRSRPEPVVPWESRFAMTPKRRRAMRRNAHGTRYATIVRHAETLARRRNVLFLTPGHEYTSQDCPACGRRERKTLAQRVHDCPCGLVLPRDQASAIETGGRAFRPFIVSADPGGEIAKRAAKASEALAKEERAWERRRKAGAMGAAAREANRASRKAGSSPGEGVDSLGFPQGGGTAGHESERMVNAR